MTAEVAIVASIVAAHQAFVRVRDNPPRGSRFIIELPVRRSARLFGSGADLSEASDNRVDSVDNVKHRIHNGHGTQ